MSTSIKANKIYKADSLYNTIAKAAIVLLFIVGVAALWLILKLGFNNPETSQFRLLPLLCIGLGAFLFYRGRQLSDQPSFKLTDDAIIIIENKTRTERAIQLKDITEQRTFYLGRGYYVEHLAFRKNENEEWYIIGAGIKEANELIYRFKDAYLLNRLPILQNMLESGKEVTFNMSSDNDILKNKITALKATDMLKGFKEIVTVNSEKINFKGKDYFFSDIQSVTFPSDGEIAVYSKTGDTLFTVYYLLISNPELFVELLKSRLNN
ncbi:hypothetical protein [Flavobacterium ginsengiterrae]|uniref:DUF3137 domain-containing protein n=1 Tax=Flavobacterium ginsengiterrae TaxID=871695 RepID=A0ABP7GFJ6_9FLAO